MDIDVLIKILQDAQSNCDIRNVCILRRDEEDISLFHKEDISGVSFNYCNYDSLKDFVLLIPEIM